MQVYMNEDESRSFIALGVAAGRAQVSDCIFYSDRCLSSLTIRGIISTASLITRKDGIYGGGCGCLS